MNSKSSTINSKSTDPADVSRRKLDPQALRFVIVGGINTAFSYGFYAFFLFVGFGYAMANLMALILGILFSFKTQGRFVFNNPDNRRFGRFVLVWAVIYLATIALIGQFIALGLNAYVAGALALPFSTLLSYLSQKYFVFRLTTSEVAAPEKSNPENPS